jgi:hypothetical protein
MKNLTTKRDLRCKATIRASGQTKRAFVASCRAGNETIPRNAHRI